MHPTTTMLDIRPAAIADVPALQRVIAAAFGQYRATLPPELFDVYLDDLLAVASRIEAAEVLVAVTDGDIVGTVTFYADGHSLGMGWPSGWSVFRALAVTPQRRSSGTGLTLVTACVERAAVRGAEALGLHTATFMTSAVDLYERCGFRRAPTFDITPADIFEVEGDDLPRVIAYRRDVS